MTVVLWTHQQPFACPGSNRPRPGLVQLYNAVSKAAILLQSRYTAKGFWVLGLRLFEEALQVVSLPKEKKQIKSFIEKARSFVGEEEEQRSEAPATMRAGTSERVSSNTSWSCCTCESKLQEGLQCIFFFCH